MSVLYWNPIEGWMGFPYLSSSAGLTYAYALGYRLKDNPGELWSRRFSRFKNDEVAALYGGARLIYGAFPGLFGAIGLDPKETVFLSALSSGETTANAQRSIPIIAKSCAEIVGARFELQALTKKRHNKIHNLYTVGERNAELDKAQYTCAPLEARNVMIFDDLITRGDTLSRIALAIGASNPGARVYGVALAKNEKVDFCPNPTNDQMRPEWEALWAGGEAEARAAAK